ncbi:MAG: dimethyl sulfoxide reductase anchor subunit [Opitutae bacterium]|nr:dimethyl sulfoxide reductase anchor subunit [Opitutae bacterium]
MKTAGEPAAAVDDRRPEHESAAPPARAAVSGAPRPDIAPSPAGSLRDFLDELLVEQSRLDTPAARASRAYDDSKTGDAKPKIFESLLPLSRPRAGEQYAFEVDLDACSGCKACVSACHALNGLDENETWRDTGQLLGCASDLPIVQTITSACHHCADPGCLNGCPVLAYEKDPLTGIVRHLDDQCIGCQYCVLKCPYDVPKYNARLGIVRKCDLCHQRLVHGEAPACAQACPTQAIRIVVVTTTASAAAPASPTAPNASPNESHSLVPGAVAAAGPKSKIENPKSKIPIAFPGPDPTYTRPTTRYVTARELPAGMRAADALALRPQPAHWPLVLMLTLLPWAIALQTLLLTPLASRAPNYFAFAPLALGALGLAAATFHLGQPLRAWRVFLGLRNSWFSREAVLFGAWFGLTALATFAPHLPGAAAFAALVGVAGLVCSVMIYVDTHRSFWRPASTAPRFFLGGALLALASLAILPPATASANISYYATFPLVAVLLAKLAVEFASLRGDSVSARVQRGRFVGVLCVRLGLVAGAAAALVALAPVAAEPVMAHYAKYFPAGALALLLAGELAERYLFFRAVDAPKMPGYAVR